MPKGLKRGAQGSDEVEFDMPGSSKDLEEDLEDRFEDDIHTEEVERPYYETPETEAVIDKALSQRIKKKQPPPEEPVKSKPREPIYLYIKTGLGEYTLVEQPFNTKTEAKEYAAEVYPDTKTKIMTQAQLDAYVKKMKKKALTKEEIKEDIKQGAKALGRGAQIQTGRVGKGFLEASRDVAASKRFTREYIEPEVRHAWGVDQKPPVPQRQEPQPEQPYRPPQRESRINIPQGGGVFGPKPRRQGFRQPPRQSRGINIPQQKRTHINIPEGGGVFKSPRSGIKPKQPKKPGPAFGQSPIKPRSFNFGPKPKWVGRPQQLRYPYEEIEESKSKVKKYNKPKKKRKK